jgi:hypothetical protein
VASPAEAVQTELVTLLGIDEVVVSRAQSASSVTFSVTFTGAKLRGDVSDLIVIDNGYNGCNAFTPETFAVATLRESVVPVYKLQTTEPFAFDAAPEEIENALESLSLVTDVAVSRKGEYNGFSWMVTLNSMKDENYAMLLVNGHELSAAISAKVQVISVQEYLLTGL